MTFYSLYLTIKQWWRRCNYADHTSPPRSEWKSGQEWTGNPHKNTSFIKETYFPVSTTTLAACFSPSVSLSAFLQTHCCVWTCRESPEKVHAVHFLETKSVNNAESALRRKYLPHFLRTQVSQQLHPVGVTQTRKKKCFFSSLNNWRITTSELQRNLECLFQCVFSGGLMWP